jgi:hypothetical protein
MVLADASSDLSPGIRPTVASPLGDVPKPHSDELRLIVNTRHVNEHLVKRVFKFESLSNVADMAKNEITISRMTLLPVIIM